MRKSAVGRLSDHHIDENNVWYLHYSSYHAELFKALEEFASGRILDIGCGNKPYQSLLSSAIEYIGCDIIQSSEQRVDIICPANSIPIEDHQFDTVISTQTIEHVEDHQGLVNEAFRLLKKGGFFILSGPMYWPLHEEPYDFFRFTKHGFRYVLEKAGFEILTIKSNGGKWLVAGQALIHALYPDMYYMKGLKGKIIRAAIRSVGGVRGLNKLFLSLDNKNTDYTNTMNYVIVARKP